MAIWRKYFICAIAILTSTATMHASSGNGMISGKVLSIDGVPIDFATVLLKGTTLSCPTNEKGLYHISAPAGEYTIIFSSCKNAKYRVPTAKNTLNNIRKTLITFGCLI